jgi:hypothetical protein
MPLKNIEFYPSAGSQFQQLLEQANKETLIEVKAEDVLPSP